MRLVVMELFKVQASLSVCMNICPRDVGDKDHIINFNACIKKIFCNNFTNSIISTEIKTRRSLTFPETRKETREKNSDPIKNEILTFCPLSADRLIFFPIDFKLGISPCQIYYSFLLKPI